MSWQARGLTLWLRRYERPVLARLTSVPYQRRRFERQARLFPKLRRRVRAETVQLAGLSCLRILPRAGATARFRLLYLHGGAYIMGSARTHRGLAAQLADLVGCEVLLPDYRLAPEHPFPAAFEDGCALAAALQQDGLPLVLGGDSAGGGLCLALLGHLCRGGTPPLGAIAFSPRTDLTLTGDSLRRNAGTEVLLPIERIVEVRDWYSAGADLTDPRLSPLFATFPAPPPVLIQWSDSEALADDAARMVQHLRAAGGTVRAEVYPGLPHVWQMFAGGLPEAGQALRAAAAFLNGLTSGPEGADVADHPTAADVIR